MENYPESLIQTHEDNKIEFILHPESEIEIAKNLCAFANTEGGKILIGVRKNGKIAGIEPSEIYSLTTNAAEKFCKPPVSVEIHAHQLNYKIVLEVNVPKSREVHKVFENGRLITYIRFKNLSLEANTVLKNYLNLKLTQNDKSIEYSEEIKEILNSLKENKRLSLTQIVRKVNIKRETVEYLIALLLLKEVLKMDILENSIVYFPHSEV